MNLASVNMDWMKEYVIRSENGIMMHVGVNGKNEMIRVLAKMITCGIPIASVLRHVKLRIFRYWKLFMQKTSIW